MKFSYPEIAVSKPLPTLADNEFESVAWGIENYGEDFKKLVVNKPAVGDQDVKIEMKFCGICHSDVHFALNELAAGSGSGSMYPIVPGHELVGTVVEVGRAVSRVAVGDDVAVGCIRDSCMDCKSCDSGDENYCAKGFTHTYNSPKSPAYSHIGGNQEVQNFGGYTQFDVVHERFVCKIPDGMELSKAGPIVCAGVTMWDPLKHWGATQPGKKMDIGIVGIGGLGTMGIKLASALGHRVVAISRSARKEELARSKGAHGFVVSTDPKSVEKEAGKLDLILDTIPAHHSIMPYLTMLSSSGTVVQLGCVGPLMEYSQLVLMFRRLSIASSVIGGVPSTQEVLDFCNKHNIYSDVKIVTADRLNEVYDELQDNNSDATRYVLDIKESLKL